MMPILTAGKSGEIIHILNRSGRTILLSSRNRKNLVTGSEYLAMYTMLRLKRRPELIKRLSEKTLANRSDR
jgi:hypothetical protein